MKVNLVKILEIALRIKIARINFGRMFSSLGKKICKQQFHLENVDKVLYRIPIWYISQIKVDRNVYSSKIVQKRAKAVGDFFILFTLEYPLVLSRFCI